MSEELSGETKPTICYVVPRLYNIQSMLNSIVIKHANPSTKRFASILIKLLEERFPKCGSDNFIYAAATIVHPYYQGMMLFDLGNRDEVMDQFMKENEETEAGDDLNAARANDDFDEEDMSCEAMTQRAFQKRRQQSGKMHIDSFIVTCYRIIPNN